MLDTLALVEFPKKKKDRKRHIYSAVLSRDLLGRLILANSEILGSLAM